MAMLGSILIVMIVLSAAVYLLQLLPIPAPFGWVKQALIVVIVACALIWLITVLTGGNSYGVFEPFSRSRIGQ